MSTPFLLTVVVGTMACVTVVTYFDHQGDEDDSQRSMAVLDERAK